MYPENWVTDNRRVHYADKIRPGGGIINYDELTSDGRLSGREPRTPATWLADGQPLVVRFKIKNLFGRYSYDLYAPEGQNPRLMLIYGSNGSGKTNVLRILWHIMSSAPNRHHRTTLKRTPFEGARVDLSNGSSIVLEKNSGLTGPYSISIVEDGKSSVSSWPDKLANSANSRLLATLNESDYAILPAGYKEAIEETKLREEYYTFLNSVNGSPILLADDRKIYSDKFEASQTQDRPRDYEEYRKIDHIPDESQSQVSREAEIAIARAGIYFTNLALGGTESGSAGANTVYLEILRRLAGTGQTEGNSPSDTRGLIEFLHKVGERNRPFSNLGLVPSFNANQYISTLQTIPPDSRPIADQVVRPYLDSLMARLDALQASQQIIQTFLDEVNWFLNDKSIAFSPVDGLQLRSVDSDPLSTAQLSSGERQLLLLLCNARISGNESMMFLIDEPELSLNVKWQRRIVSALLSCTHGTPVQFILATHSVELLSQYRSNVVRLERVDELSLW